MDFFSQIINCQSDEEADKLVTEKLEILKKSKEPVEQLGFLPYNKSTYTYKGFIPLETRIKYANLNLETYSMNTTDFFYEFVHNIRKNKIKNKYQVILYLETFINEYFGYDLKEDREDIFNNNAWNSTTTDEEYFKALENNKIGDLKHKNAAQCTERGALAQQLLSLFDLETYYCVGYFKNDYKEEPHCFNIVKSKSAYALIDYSAVVTIYDKNKNIKTFFPFMGAISNEEFEKFISNEVVKEFPEYIYINTNEKVNLKTSRKYVIGAFEIEKTKHK